MRQLLKVTFKQHIDEESVDLKFDLASPKSLSSIAHDRETLKFEEKNLTEVNNSMLSQLNYDEVISRANQREEHDLDTLIGKEDNQEEKDLGRLSSLGDDVINPIKRFSTKTNRIYTDSEHGKLNSSMASQKSIDPFMMMNSSLLSTYLYNNGTNNYDRSNTGSPVHSPLKRNSMMSNGGRNLMDHTVNLNIINRRVILL